MQLFSTTVDVNYVDLTSLLGLYFQVKTATPENQRIELLEL